MKNALELVREAYLEGFFEALRFIRSLEKNMSLELAVTSTEVIALRIKQEETHHENNRDS